MSQKGHGMKPIFHIASLFLWTVSFLHADLLQTILENKTLKVCIWPEYYSISYVNPRTQKLTGIDVDLAKRLAQTLDVQPLFVSSSFATLIQDVTTHRCDIAMFAVGQTPAREKYLRFTSPHLMSDIYAIASKSNRRITTWDDIDQEGVVVAVAKGTYHVEVMQQSLQKAKLLIVDTLHAREQEVQAGRADVFMTDYPFGIQLLHETAWAKLIAPTVPFHKTYYGWALSKESDANSFFQKVEQFMQTIKRDGTLLETARHYQLDPIVVTE